MVIAATAATALTAISSALATESQDRRVRLQFGPNAIDLNKDSRDDVIFVSWRESNNGQGYRILNFSVNSGESRELLPERRQRLRLDPNNPPPEARADSLWETVLIEDPETGLLDPAVYEKESGHCALKRAGLLLTQLDEASETPDIILVIAEKRGYDKVFDEIPISVDLYLLETNDKGEPGQPTYKFRLVRSDKTETAFCDAQAALDSLLPD